MKNCVCVSAFFLTFKYTHRKRKTGTVWTREANRTRPWNISFRYNFPLKRRTQTLSHILTSPRCRRIRFRFNPVNARFFVYVCVCLSLYVCTVEEGWKQFLLIEIYFYTPFRCHDAANSGPDMWFDLGILFKLRFVLSLKWNLFIY